MTREVLFKVNELNLYYGATQALKNITIDIYPNEVVALIGPSGCGKSTFIRTLNRMNDLIDHCKIDGKITYCNQNIYAADVDVYELRKKVGMVFQKPNPFPMSIYENVAYGPKCQGIKNKKELDFIVEESLQQAALWDEVSSRLHESALSLSGGQQQRLCIARALAMKPDVLLMDEPTSALDPIATSKIEDLIFNLKQKYSIIIVTHNMQQASRISDRCAFFYLGEIVEYDLTNKLFTNPKEQQTEDYISGKMG